jgi:hypothetical protein
MTFIIIVLKVFNFHYKKIQKFFEILLHFKRFYNILFLSNVFLRDKHSFLIQMNSSVILF